MCSFASRTKAEPLQEVSAVTPAGLQVRPCTVFTRSERGRSAAAQLCLHRTALSTAFLQNFFKG